MVGHTPKSTERPLGMMFFPNRGYLSGDDPCGVILVRAIKTFGALALNLDVLLVGSGWHPNRGVGEVLVYVPVGRTGLLGLRPRDSVCLRARPPARSLVCEPGSAVD